jgi:hypothetical protein
MITFCCKSIWIYKFFVKLFCKGFEGCTHKAFFKWNFAVLLTY